MGLDPNSIRFLLHAHRIGVEFGRSLMIGRQRLNLGASELHDAFVEFGLDDSSEELAALHRADDRFADGLLLRLGAREVSSLDMSDYQGASIRHDLNTPIAESLHEAFELVIDSGTLEHIFDTPTALRSCLSAVAPGGHYLAVVPANNYLGHGFYQFSPELFFRVLSATNGFRIRSCVAYTNNTIGRWYEVTDPDVARRRVTLTNDQPTYLALLATRERVVPIMESAPQQSDYVTTWAGHDQPSTVAAAVQDSSTRRVADRVNSAIPDAMAARLRRGLASTRRRVQHRTARGFDTDVFSPVRPIELRGD